MMHRNGYGYGYGNISGDGSGNGYGYDNGSGYGYGKENPYATRLLIPNVDPLLSLINQSHLIGINK